MFIIEGIFRAARRVRPDTDRHGPVKRVRLTRASHFLGNMRPDYHQLVVFLKVVESRSFSGAARCLNRTQPAISQAIMRLEEICGASLFERRRGAPLVLSPVGEVLLGSARTVVALIDQQMADAISTARGRRGTLTLGFSGSLTAAPLQSGIAAFVTDCPEAELRLIEGNSGDLDRQLLSNQLDLVIAPRSPGFVDARLAEEALWTEPLVAVLPATHKLSKKPTIQWQDFGKLTIILRHTATTEHDYYLTLAGFNLDVRLHEISRTALLDVVGLGIGVTVVPQSEVTTRSDVTFRPIDEADATISFSAAWFEADTKPLRHRFLSCIRRYR